MNLKINRRNILSTALFGASAIGLRSLASGLPASMILDPLSARAETTSPGRVMILSVASAGDPINTHAPGTFEHDRVEHSADPRLAPTSMQLGDSAPVIAGKPWADLPQDILDRTAFLHHGTYTNIHSNHPKVMRLMGAVEQNEMLISLLSRQLAPTLETTQPEPVSVGANIGGELLSFDGRTLSNVSPNALKASLGEFGELAELTTLRNSTLDQVHAIYREHGTPNQRLMLDRFASTREQADELPRDLVGRLSEIRGNQVQDQLIAATVLAAMNVSPVITVRIPFGGDNHDDGEFRAESEQTVSGVAHLQTLVESIDRMNEEGILRHPVMVGTMNVFGRTLARQGRTGRDHNGRHHCTVLIGDGVKAGVYGGITEHGEDFQAQAMNSSTGEASPDGDIPHEETHQAVAKTIGCMVGVSEQHLSETISGGQPIRALLS